LSLPHLSVICPYFNHLDEVQAQIERWSKIDRVYLDKIEFILVDDCSEEFRQLDPCGLTLRQFRIDTDKKWNQAGARNLGFMQARGEWSLVFDIDLLLTDEAIPEIINGIPSLNPIYMYFLAIRDLWNYLENRPAAYCPSAHLVRTDRFRIMGMYDEDFVGHYGYEDTFVQFTWIMNGGKLILLGKPYFFDRLLDFHTEGSDRDLTHNGELLITKRQTISDLPEPRRVSPKNLLRFDWHEVSAD